MASEADAKKTLQETRARQKKDAEASAIPQGAKPTPTQDELDLMMLGATPELEDDGSGPSPRYVLRREVTDQKQGQARAQAPAARPAQQQPAPPKPA